MKTCPSPPRPNEKQIFRAVRVSHAQRCEQRNSRNVREHNFVLFVYAVDIFFFSGERTAETKLDEPAARSETVYRDAIVAVIMS